jgi:hypothetical protein
MVSEHQVGLEASLFSLDPLMLKCLIEGGDSAI